MRTFRTPAPLTPLPNLPAAPMPRSNAGLSPANDSSADIEEELATLPDARDVDLHIDANNILWSVQNATPRTADSLSFDDLAEQVETFIAKTIKVEVAKQVAEQVAGQLAQQRKQVESLRKTIADMHVVNTILMKRIEKQEQASALCGTAISAMATQAGLLQAGLLQALDAQPKIQSFYPVYGHPPPVAVATPGSAATTMAQFAPSAPLPPHTRY